jgi:hypothetical protein
LLSASLKCNVQSGCFKLVLRWRGGQDRFPHFKNWFSPTKLKTLIVKLQVLFGPGAPGTSTVRPETPKISKKEYMGAHCHQPEAACSSRSRDKAV